MGPDGALWFTNDANHSIGRITTTGTITHYTGPGISAPVGIVAGPDGALWFINQGAPPASPSIGRITTTGTVTHYSLPSILPPQETTVGPDGALWFTNVFGNSIGQIDTQGHILDYFTGAGFSNPLGIAAGPGGGMWFTNSGNDTIGRIQALGYASPVSCGGLPVTTRGGARGDRIAGTSKRDVILGGSGNDRINAAGGSDRVCAGAGNDRVLGGRGNDRLLRQTGRDTLLGEAGRDLLRGGPGNDRLLGGPSNDRLLGGPGNDRITPGPVRGERDAFLLLIDFWGHAVRDPTAAERFAQRHARLRATVGHLLDAAIPEREPGVGLPSDQLATTLIALANGFAIELLADPDAVPDDLLGHAIGALVQGSRVPR